MIKNECFTNVHESLNHQEMKQRKNKQIEIFHACLKWIFMFDMLVLYCAIQLYVIHSFQLSSIYHGSTLSAVADTTHYLLNLTDFDIMVRTYYVPFKTTIYFLFFSSFQKRGFL